MSNQQGRTGKSPQPIPKPVIQPRIQQRPTQLVHKSLLGKRSPNGRIETR